ncbi:MAG: hypothetical protein GX817_04465 [Elusimicrobia bacterium]|nr:hypothetical protein [Elusimicrobiota bacterium]
MRSALETVASGRKRSCPNLKIKESSIPSPEKLVAALLTSGVTSRNVASDDLKPAAIKMEKNRNVRMMD